MSRLGNIMSHCFVHAHFKTLIVQALFVYFVFCKVYRIELMRFSPNVSMVSLHQRNNRERFSNEVHFDLWFMPPKARPFKAEKAWPSFETFCFFEILFPFIVSTDFVGTQNLKFLRQRQPQNTFTHAVSTSQCVFDIAISIH